MPLAPTQSLQLEYVRQQFPALLGDWIFFDNAGGSQILKPVVDRISEYLLTSNVQLGASYAISQLAGERVLCAREAVATLLNAASSTEVVMGGSTSLLLRILSLCLVQNWTVGDEVIVTNTDHEANVSPWMDLKQQGIVVKTWRLNPDTLELQLDDLEALMTPRTRLVAVTHASNILGTINPIRQIADRVHTYGAMLCVDGVGYAAHRLVDVQALDVDFYAFSFYKTYGPHYAVLYGKQAHLLSLPSINHYFIEQTDIPYKFQPGNVNYELSYGVLGLCDYLSHLATLHDPTAIEQSPRQRMVQAFDLIRSHEAILGDRLLCYLNSQPNVRIIGHPRANPDDRVPTISFVVDGIDSATIPPQLDPHRIAIRYGDFYAKRLIEELGLTAQHGVVRVSMVHYNTLAEVDRLIECFDRVF
ncbi:cysteine desulfurase-like protein [Thermocoleostomius sinensis]|uniref:Cysteine desulfurase-like protein n=1 Tax=Thermocoleostomius sinensis A174 TaxID=2016057 RepID=A0A9E8ZF44_9CYAN|nr:cysteine desulfurase-like protein [Thermocoleostomius sinensis]WAL62008.1 cysteine desulfurase-like protein [Thermocoleostomius sinensis A174]